MPSLRSIIDLSGVVLEPLSDAIPGYVRRVAFCEVSLKIVDAAREDFRILMVKNHMGIVRIIRISSY